MKKTDRQNHILDLMRGASPEQLIFTKDLAEEFDVSEATIRRDFQELAEAGLLERQYGGAQSTRVVNRKLKQVGILLASRIDKYTDPFYNLVLEGADHTLSQLGYHVAYVKTFYDVPTAHHAQDLLDTFDIQGMIILGTTHDESFYYLRKHFKPVVTVMDVFGLESDHITFDGHNGMWKLIKHLSGLGYQKPAYISGYKDRRYDGFIQGLTDFGLVNDDSLHKIIKPGASGWTPDLGEKGAEMLMGQSLIPDVIVCASDWLAIGAMRWLQKNGYRIPEDIAVTGFDNISDSAFTFPPLTTVNVHKELLGQLAAERIVRLIENPDEVALHIITPTQLIVRESCGVKLDRA